ncbi:branched-subunit amino acid transport protein [Amorphus suaedae]
MTAADSLTLPGLGPYLTILVAAALPTHVWRWLGVLFAGKLSEDSEVFRWIKAVATALVSGLIAQLILFPSGTLAEVAVPVRIACVVLGMAVYFATRKNLALGILASEAALIAAWFLL